jgi:hypothetical protein
MKNSERITFNEWFDNNNGFSVLESAGKYLF